MIMNWEPFSIIPESADLLPDPHVETYPAVRERVYRFLIRYALVDSYRNFQEARQPYPFVTTASLRPGSVAPSKEYDLQNNLLVILLNGELPGRLRKHFRCREGNLVRKNNLVDVAPDLPELADFQHSLRFAHHERFEDLLRMLLPLDYALIIQRTPCKDGKNHHFELTHFHVKIERLMDNALRAMGVHLNYFERGLYERGEAFIDSLERKFFEYFNFYHNAAGRRSAAALAAQLLARERVQATVFVASQQTRRLTALTSSGVDEDIFIEQSILLDMDAEDLTQLEGWGRKNGLPIGKHYLVDRLSDGGVMIFRAAYEHTEASRPSPNGRLKKEINSREKWVRLCEESLVPVVEAQRSRITCPLVYRRHHADEKME